MPTIKELRQQSVDLYAGLPNRHNYLPRFESNQVSYDKRVRNSKLRNYYRQGIDHICAVLAFIKFTKDSPLTLAQNLGLGYNLVNFLTVADTIAQRDGGLYIDISDRDKLTHVSLGMLIDDNKYRTIAGKFVTVDPQLLVPYYYNYGLPEPGDFSFKPLHQDLLEINLSWFKLNSQYQAILEYYAKPVLVRSRNQIVANQKHEVVDFEAGNKLIEIASGEELYFLSLDTANVEPTLTELVRQEEAMQELLNNVLSIGVSNASKTATEVNLIKAESLLTYSGLVQAKRANVMRLMYAFYLHHYPQYTNTIEVQIVNPYSLELDNLTALDTY